MGFLFQFPHSSVIWNWTVMGAKRVLDFGLVTDIMVKLWLQGVFQIHLVM